MLSNSETNFPSYKIELAVADSLQSIMSWIIPILSLTPASGKINNPFS